MITSYLLQGQLLRNGFIFHLLDLFHQLVHLELLLLLQVLLQLCLLMLQLGWRSDTFREETRGQPRRVTRNTSDDCRWTLARAGLAFTGTLMFGSSQTTEEPQRSLQQLSNTNMHKSPRSTFKVDLFIRLTF